MSGPPTFRRAPDGSPYPDRGRAGFEREVRAMFTHIADRYDWFDHLASLGQDYLWRPRALWELDRYRGGRPVGRILDVGCGPGDLTVLAAHHFPRAEALGIDFTSAMLRNARRRTGPMQRAGRIRFARADAGRLPFASGSFDLVLSAFVIRNLPDLSAAFEEMRRVLRPGGSMLALEITEPEHEGIGRMFHAYFDHVVPWLGAAFGSSGPYRYLPESVRFLPDRAGLLERMARSGLDRPEARPQFLGVVTAYLGQAPADKVMPAPGAGSGR
ncbi:MAG: ubiquinone/menaquinone biosynthesis methyltransferase [Thermoplasmata archaeon]